MVRARRTRSLIQSRYKQDYRFCPNGTIILSLIFKGTPEDLQETLAAVEAAKPVWRAVPSPQRGEIVRQMREQLAAKLDPLGRLVALEMGKILPEGIGEVQEYIDVCDYATGLSRMLNGAVIPSERPGHFSIVFITSHNTIQ